MSHLEYHQRVVLDASLALWIRYLIQINSRHGPPCCAETFARVRSVGADSGTDDATR